MPPRSTGGAAALANLLSTLLASPATLSTALWRRVAGIQIGPDGVQVQPHQLHRHRKLIHRLIEQGHKVVLKNGTGRPLTILRVTNLDPFPPPDESDLEEHDFTVSVPDSSWLD